MCELNGASLENFDMGMTGRTVDDSDTVLSMVGRLLLLMRSGFTACIKGFSGSPRARVSISA